jgi:PPP family 3-phenylpropionic acid transporter
LSLFTQLSTSYFFYFSILGLVVPFVAVFLDGKGFSSTEIGEILAIVTASKIFGPSLWAVLADKTGRQLSIIRLGALLAAGCFSFLFWLTNYWPITFILAIFSLFWTAILPQLEVMTLNSVRRSPKIYARIRLWGSIGFIVMAVLAGDFIERYSHDAFTVLGLAVLLALYLSTLVLKQPKIHLSQITATSTIKSKVLDFSFIVFFVAGLMLQISFGPYYNFFAMFLRDQHYSGIVIGLLIGLGVAAEIIVFIYAGKLFKLFTIKTLLVFSLFITAIRWTLLAQSGDNFWVLIFSQVMHAASFGLYHSASIAFIGHHFDVNQQSRGQALYVGCVYGIGGAIGAYLAGVLWFDGLGAQLSFNLAAVTVLVGMIFALFIRSSATHTVK